MLGYTEDPSGQLGLQQLWQMIGEPLQVLSNINIGSASSSTFVTIMLNVNAIESQPEEEEEKQEEEVIPALVTYSKKKKK